MKQASSTAFWVGARILVGLVFAYAGLSKLLEPTANFESVLLKYGVFSPLWIPWIARIVPWLEWLLGSFMILGYAPRAAALGTGVTALCFLVTLSSSRLFLEAGGTDCGCFGKSGLLHLSLQQIFAVDLLIFLASLRLVFLDRLPWSLHQALLKRKG